MRHLDASTGTRANKISKSWPDIMKECGIASSEPDMGLVHVTEAFSKRWEGRQVVMLLDEILDDKILLNLGDQSIPESVRLILVINPITSLTHLTLSPSFLQVTLTVPYRSTIAITRLARFMAKCNNLVVPEGDFGSDVEGIRPIIFDVGNNERKMQEALEHCHKQLGDNATILYDHPNREPIEKWMKAAGADWDGSNTSSFYGWEDDTVVVVTDGSHMMELLTRARTKIVIILVEGQGECEYAEQKGFFLQAVEEGLATLGGFKSWERRDILTGKHDLFSPV